MYGLLGADTIGMSTVGEVLVARQVGLPVVGVAASQTMRQVMTAKRF